MSDSRNRTGDKASHHAALLIRCRAPLLAFCEQRLDFMMDQAGTVLLDFAERAESNTVQGRFFEAIAHLSHHRDAFVRSFLTTVADDFEQFGKADSSVVDAEVGGTPELSLIDPEDMEQSVACENIIIKANANCFPELYALSQRLAVINDGKKVKDSEIVGGPHQLVHALRNAMRPLAVDVKVKIVLYALFDKAVMREVLSVYRHERAAQGRRHPASHQARQRQEGARAPDPRARAAGGAGEQRRRRAG
jgi:hypothetical protein